MGYEERFEVSYKTRYKTSLTHRQVQLQREELLLELAQLAQRARVGRVLHQGQDHLESLDQLSGGVVDQHCQKNNQYDAEMLVIMLTKLVSG